MQSLTAGVKRKHTDQADDQVNKHLHLDPETSDGFADLATLVNMSSAASLAVSQVENLALSCSQAAVHTGSYLHSDSATDNQDSLDNRSFYSCVSSPMKWRLEVILL